MSADKRLMTRDEFAARWPEFDLTVREEPGGRGPWHASAMWVAEVSYDGEEAVIADLSQSLEGAERDWVAHAMRDRMSRETRERLHRALLDVAALLDALGID